MISTQQKFSVNQQVFLFSSIDSSLQLKAGIIKGVHFAKEDGSIWYRVIYYAPNQTKRDAWFAQKHLFETLEEANLVLNTQTIV